MSSPGGPGATVPRGTRSAWVSGSRLSTRVTAALRSHGSSWPTALRLVERGLELAGAGRERGEIRRLRRGNAVQHVRVGAEHLTVQIEAGEGQLRPPASQERPERRAVVEPVGEHAAALAVAQRQGRHLRKQIEERRVHLPIEPGARAREIGHGEGHHEGRGRTRPDHSPAHGPGHRRCHRREQQHERRVAPRDLDQPRPEGLEDTRPRRPGRGARPSARRPPPAPPRPRRPPTPRTGPRGGSRRAAGRRRSRRPGPPRSAAAAAPWPGNGTTTPGEASRRATRGLPAPRARTTGREPPARARRGGNGAAARQAPRAARASVRGPKYRDRKYGSPLLKNRPPHQASAGAWGAPNRLGRRAWSSTAGCTALARTTSGARPAPRAVSGNRPATRATGSPASPTPSTTANARRPRVCRRGEAARPSAPPSTTACATNSTAIVETASARTRAAAGTCRPPRRAARRRSPATKGASASACRKT